MYAYLKYKSDCCPRKRRVTWVILDSGIANCDKLLNPARDLRKDVTQDYGIFVGSSLHNQSIRFADCLLCFDCRQNVFQID